MMTNMSSVLLLLVSAQVGICSPNNDLQETEVLESVSAALSGVKLYNGYSVLSVHNMNDMDDVDVVLGIREKYEHTRKVIFIDEIPIPKKPLTFLVSSKAEEDIKSILDQGNFKYQTHITDLGEHFHELEIQNNQFLQRFDDSPEPTAPIHYFNPSQLEQFLVGLVARHPHDAKLVSVGKSSEGREIWYLQINPDKTDRPIIFLTAGLDPSVKQTTYIALWIAYQVLENKLNESKYIKDGFRLFIVAEANPDGAAYVYQQDPLWRKSRASNGENCYGVNLNKNWGSFYGHAGSTDDACSVKFCGSKDFSEVETRHLRDAIVAVQEYVVAYINLESWRESIYVPWSGKDIMKTTDHEDLRDLGKIMAKKMAAVPESQEFRVGTHPDLLYLAGGTPTDWVKEHTPVKWVYSLGVQPLGGAGHLGLLPAAKLSPASHEILVGLDAMARGITNWQQTVRSGQENDNGLPEKHKFHEKGEL